jgi:hypothetical protein
VRFSFPALPFLSFLPCLPSFRPSDSAVSTLTTNLPGPFAVVLTTIPSSSLPRSSARKPCHSDKKAKLAKRQEYAEVTEEEYVEELLDEIAKEDALDDMIEKMEQVEEATLAADDDASAPVANADYAADSSDLGVTDVTADPSTVEALAQEESLAYAGDADDETYTSWDGESVLDVSPFQKGNGSNNGTSIFAPKEGSGLFHRYVFFTPAIIFCAFPPLPTSPSFPC